MADEIDYEVFGSEMQYVEVELDPMEAAVAEAGGMMYMEDGIQMDTVFGDGSAQNKGFMGALLGAGKRLLTGESLFTTVFHNEGQGKRKGPEGTRVMGKVKAFEFCSSGEPMPVEEAERLGVVNRVVPLAELETAGERVPRSGRLVSEHNGHDAVCL